MDLSQPFAGVVVGFVTFDYDMTDRPGGTKGTSYRLWVSPGMGEAPWSVKVPASWVEACGSLAFGEQVSGKATARAQNKGRDRAVIEWTLDALDQAVPAAGGRRREQLRAG